VTQQSHDIHVNACTYLWQKIVHLAKTVDTRWWMGWVWWP